MLSDLIFTRLGENALLLAPDLTVLDLTAAALAALERGLFLKLVRGRLACPDARRTSRLRRLVRVLADRCDLASVGSLALPRDDGGEPALASFFVVPDPRPTDGRRSSAPVVLARVVEPATRPAARPSDLRALFGLTPAEARLACTILDAGSLREVAERLGIAVTTARTHLTRVFAKTGTSRQSQLVRLVLAYGAVHSRPHDSEP